MDKILQFEEDVNFLARFLLFEKCGIDVEDYLDKIYDDNDLQSMLYFHQAWCEDHNKGDRAVLEKGYYVINKVIDLDDFNEADIESDFIACVFENYDKNKDLIKGKTFMCREYNDNFQ